VFFVVKIFYHKGHKEKHKERKNVKKCKMQNETLNQINNNQQPKK